MIYSNKLHLFYTKQKFGLCVPPVQKGKTQLNPRGSGQEGAQQ